VFYRWIEPNAVADSEPHTNLHRFKNGLRDALPYIGLTVVYLGIRYLALKGLIRPLTPLPITTLIYTWPSILVFYVRLLVWPFGLSVFYETPYVKSPQFQNFIFPLLVLTALSLGFYFLAKRNRVIAFLSFWMLLPILPVLNFSVFVHGELAHDRYLYLPSIGFCMLLAMAIRRLKHGSSIFLRLPISQVAAVLLLAGVFAGVTAQQNKFWSSDFSLAARGVEIAPGNTMAANNLAKEMAVRGDYEHAIPLFRQVIERRPTYWLPHFNLGYVYYRLGDLREAEHYLRRAIQIAPGDAAEHRFLGCTLLEMGRKDEAEQELRLAISLKSNAPDQHYALGTLLEERKDLPGALKEFQMEFQVNPKNTEVKQKIDEMEKSIRGQPR
jgi:tetratricopeptide (TPR) repeat protein